MNLSSVTPPGILSAQLPNPREFDPRNPRDFGANASLWSTIQFKFNGEKLSDKDGSTISGWIEAVGSTFQITELEGANSIGVRFDTVGTFVKMQEGDIFEGSFSRIQFRALQKVASDPTIFDAAPYPDIVINGLASNGGRIIKAPRREGLNAGFQTWTGTATSSGGTDIIAAYKTMYASGAAGFRRNLVTPGAGGGQIIIKNTGSATLYLYTANASSSNFYNWNDTTAIIFPNTRSSFPLNAGETITIPLKSRLQTLMVATSSGATGSWAAMADSMGDSTTTGESTLA